MKRYLLALLVSLGLIVGGLGAGSAAAAPSRGATCYLSANWPVQLSATWYGSDLSYAVITSPGPLFYGTASGVLTRAVAYTPSAEYTRSFARVGSGTNPYTYRANWTNGPNATVVNITAEAYPSGITCNKDLVL